MKKWGLFSVGIAAFTFGLLFHIQFAIKSSNDSPTADFAAFYVAASVVLDPEISTSKIYDHDLISSIHHKYEIDVVPAHYLYSVAAAYALTPLALLPYSTAKTVWSLANLLLYLLSVLIIFRLAQPLQLKICFVLAFSMFWVPFLFNQYWLQSNTILLFVVTVALLAITKKRPYLGGTLLGFATLIKLFPIAIPIVLALKNPRILIACIATFASSLLLPGSLKWLDAIRHEHPNYTPIYIWLSQFGIVWFVVYAIAIAGITALVGYYSSKKEYPVLAAVTIPAALLISPVVGGYYLVLLMFSFVYLLEYSDGGKWLSVLTFISFAWINLTMLVYDSYLSGLIFFWVTTILWLSINLRIEPKSL